MAANSERVGDLLGHGAIQCRSCTAIGTFASVKEAATWLRTHDHLAKPKRRGTPRQHITPAKKIVTAHCPSCRRFVRGFTQPTLVAGGAVVLRGHYQTGNPNPCAGSGRRVWVRDFRSRATHVIGAT